MNSRYWIATLLLSAAAVISFVLPVPKYENPIPLDLLNIPTHMRDWRSRDMTEELNLEGDDRYKFIGHVFARIYGTRRGENLLFLVLDVNNFHPPADCFTSSGFKVTRLKNPELRLGERTLTPRAFLAEKGRTRFLVLYWITINKKIIQNWTYGEIQQLLFNLLNRRRSGLMMRLDIPVEDGTIEDTFQWAERFLTDLEKNAQTDDADLLFGTTE